MQTPETETTPQKCQLGDVCLSFWDILFCWGQCPAVMGEMKSEIHPKTEIIYKTIIPSVAVIPSKKVFGSRHGFFLKERCLDSSLQFVSNTFPPLSAPMVAERPEVRKRERRVHLHL